ncbi:ABC transporter ATP-binding protein [Aerobium aerolatum]
MDETAPPQASREGAVLEVKGLRTVFRQRGVDVSVVNDVNFDIRAGETVALVGESGSGKSVSALSVMRLVPSPKGRIAGGQVLLDGEDLLRLDEPAMRGIRGKTIGMVFQEPMTSLNPIHTIGRQLGEGLRIHLGLTGKAARERSIELLDSVGIPRPAERLHAYPHQLSGGMCQRVMIAIALSCEPRILLADEPTTALDVTTQAQILELMDARARALGTATLLITHDLGIVARYASRVNVMYAGRIVEQGEARQLYDNPRHPYTRGLLESVPRLDRPRRQELPAIEGLPPSPGSLPQGCPFQPRCPFRQEICGQPQALREISPGRRVACIRADELSPFDGAA